MKEFHVEWLQYNNMIVTLGNERPNLWTKGWRKTINQIRLLLQINRAITFRDLIEPVRMRHPHDRYYYTLSLNWTATSPTMQTDCFPMIAWTIRKGDSTLLIYMMSL